MQIVLSSNGKFWIKDTISITLIISNGGDGKSNGTEASRVYAREKLICVN